MKPRKVVVTMEIISKAPIKDIRHAYLTQPNHYGIPYGTDVVEQLQINVVRDRKKK